MTTVNVLEVMDRAAKQMIASGFNNPMAIGHELVHAKNVIAELIDECEKIRTSKSSITRTAHMYEMFAVLSRIGGGA